MAEASANAITPNASNSTWRPAGFGGAGAFLSLHFDQTQPGVIYTTSDVGGVYRSSDYGQHWEMRSVGLGNTAWLPAAYAHAQCIRPMEHGSVWVLAEL